MNALRARATGFENDPARLPPPSFNIRDRNKLKEIGQEIKSIYIKDGSKWQDHLGLAIAVCFIVQNSTFSIKSYIFCSTFRKKKKL